MRGAEPPRRPGGAPGRAGAGSGAPTAYRPSVLTGFGALRRDAREGNLSSGNAWGFFPDAEGGFAVRPRLMLHVTVPIFLAVSAAGVACFIWLQSRAPSPDVVAIAGFATTAAIGGGAAALYTNVRMWRRSLPALAVDARSGDVFVHGERVCRRDDVRRIELVRYATVRGTRSNRVTTFHRDLVLTCRDGAGGERHHRLLGRAETRKLAPKIAAHLGVPLTESDLGRIA